MPNTFLYVTLKIKGIRLVLCLSCRPLFMRSVLATSCGCVRCVKGLMGKVCARLGDVGTDEPGCHDVATDRRDFIALQLTLLHSYSYR